MPIPEVTQRAIDLAFQYDEGPCFQVGDMEFFLQYAHPRSGYYPGREKDAQTNILKAAYRQAARERDELKSLRAKQSTISTP